MCQYSIRISACRDVVISLDFAFSFMRWFVEKLGAKLIEELWNLDSVQGEERLGSCPDLRVLARISVPATGWDLVFRPDGFQKPTDIVNLGFVLNVIEKRKSPNNCDSMNCPPRKNSA